jgi:RNA recognition motif-containing protein
MVSDDVVAADIAATFAQGDGSLIDGWTERPWRCAVTETAESMNTRLFVGNLSFHTTEDDLQQVFAEYGEVLDLKIMQDRETGRSRGFGFVTMGNADEAKKAMDALDGTELDQRTLRVNEAEQRRDRNGGGAPRSGGRSRW